MEIQSRTINLLGIAGRINSGKDTVAGIIQQLCREQYEYFTWKNKKFSGKLKQIASLLTGIPAEKFEDQEFKKTFLGREWDYLVSKPGLRQDGWPGKGEKEIKQYEVRLFLQKLGTDAIRDNVHENSWINALFADYKGSPCGKEGVIPCGADYIVEKTKEIVKPETHPELFGEWFPYWLITDCRFENEAKAIKDRGGIVISVRRQMPENSKDLHASETSLDNWEFDWILDNRGTIEQLTEKVREMLIYFKIIRNEEKENTEPKEG